MVGQSVSHYRVTAEIGGGGMGVVYEAEDSRLGRRVALKFLPESAARDKPALERFLREARAASALNHPNICTIHDIGEHQGQPYIVMELLTGQTVRQRIRGGSLSLDTVVELATQIADALDAAHTQGITHRDVKPANLFLTDRGHAKILDFGLAKLAQQTPTGATPDDGAETLDQVNLTSPGATVGTVAYMSPEQARGEEVDHRSDIFSLGVVLYEMATGRQAFTGKSTAVVFDSILNRAPAPALRANPEIPDELDRIINRCLEKDAALRYQSAADLRSELKRLRRDTTSDKSVAATAVNVPPASPADGSGSDTAIAAGLLQRHKGMLFGGLAVLAAILSAAGYGLIQMKGGDETGAIESIAVLPFENATGDPEQEYLSDGIAESLISRLSRQAGLKVIARSTSFRFKGTDPQVAGRELGVHAVLTGRVEQRGDTLVVRVELLDVEHGTQLWGERYDRERADLLQIEDAISRDIAGQLQPQLAAAGGEVTEGGGAGSPAHELVLRGRYHWHNRTPTDNQKAIEYFKQAIAADPDYAPAHAGLADAYQIGPSWGWLEPDYAFPRAEAAARRALELDETLAEAHAALGQVYYNYYRNHESAERAYRRSMALAPNYAMAYLWNGIMLIRQGRVEEAIEMTVRARELDPYNAAVATWGSIAYGYAGDWQMVIEKLEESRRKIPEHPTLVGELAIAYAEAGEPEKGLELWQRFEAGHDTSASAADLHLARLYAYAGREAEARKLLAAIPADASGSTLGYAGDTARLLGDRDAAISYFERAIEKKAWPVLFEFYESQEDPITNDPRFKDLLRRLREPVK